MLVAPSAHPRRIDVEHRRAASGAHYVGRAAGIERGTLLKGPNLPGAGQNDPGDDLSTEYGMDIWDRYEDRLSIDVFRVKVSELIDELDRRRLGRVRPWPGH